MNAERDRQMQSCHYRGREETAFRKPARAFPDFAQFPGNTLLRPTDGDQQGKREAMPVVRGNAGTVKMEEK